LDAYLTLAVHDRTIGSAHAADVLVAIVEVASEPGSLFADVGDKADAILTDIQAGKQERALDGLARLTKEHMIGLLDGPAKIETWTRRTPEFLRAVVDAKDAASFRNTMRTRMGLPAAHAAPRGLPSVRLLFARARAPTV
jgi:hypothetical protein